jgi:outer membrane protein assembly factor BamB
MAPDPAPTAYTDLIFVGVNARVAALHRDTGEIKWSWKAPNGTGAVALLLDGDRLIASVQGYTYCFDASTGAMQWHNDLVGFGFGVPSLASLRGGALSPALAQTAFEQARQAHSQ